MFCLLLAFLAAPLAHADAPLARDLSGAVVDIHGARTVLVSWSLRSPGALDGVPALEAAGLDVVLINSDTAGEASALRPFLRARGLDLPIVADPTGALRRRYQLPPSEGVALLDASGAVALLTTTRALDTAALARMAGLDAARIATR